MKALAFYNEIDPRAAQWLRELIKQNLIAPGVVDERSIEDIKPSDLEGFTQVHFFAGIGGWSAALRQARWPDDRPVWTGSCPCQPFSAAGKRTGTSDERHLWPAFEWLISQCKPNTIFGEQVASKDGLAWLDIVSTDLEGQGYAVAPGDICSAGFGSPNIRQRLYWVADTDDARSQRRYERGVRPNNPFIGTDGMALGLEHSALDGERSLDGEPGSRDESQVKDRGRGISIGMGYSEGYRRESRGSESSWGLSTGGCGPNRLADADGRNTSEEREQRSGEYGLEQEDSSTNKRGSARPTNGFWRAADWLFCKDGKWRPVEPGTFPLANGIPGRVGLLRGYGNAINVEVAAGFVGAYMEAIS